MKRYPKPNLGEKEKRTPTPEVRACPVSGWEMPRFAPGTPKIPKEAGGFAGSREISGFDPRSRLPGRPPGPRQVRFGVR